MLERAAVPRRSAILGPLRQSSGAQRWMLIVGAVLVSLFVLCALLAPWIAPYGFNDDRSGGMVFAALRPPSGSHLFGTTAGGEDVFSRVVYGARTALEVVVVAVVLSVLIGVPLGLYAGYRGGWVDRVLVLVSDALFTFPSLLLAIVVAISLSGNGGGSGTGLVAAAIAITVVYIPQYFRLVRNATITAKQEPYVEAARVLGAPPRVVMSRYLFGNVVGSVPIIATVNAADAILTLAGLGFLGFGVEPSSAAEWGFQLNKALADTASGTWWTALFPGLAIVLLVLGISLVGESMNDVLNPLLRARRLRAVVLPPHRSAGAAPVQGVAGAARDKDMLSSTGDGIGPVPEQGRREPPAATP